MYQRIELFSNLQPDDVSSTLDACALLDKEEYTELEADRFRECRQLIEQGKSYKQAAAQFRRLDRKNKRHHNDGGDSDQSEVLQISDLLAQASEQCGQKITLKAAAQVLDICGLTDADEYSQEESDRFAIACELVTQNKSVEEIRAHLGIETNTGLTDSNLQSLIEQVSDATITAETSFSNLVDQITEKRAANLPDLVNQLYLKNAVQQLAASQEQREAFFAGLEQRIMADIEGKTSSRSLKAWGEQNLMPSLPVSAKLLPESENGTSTD